jgi:CheY-like chemotaxis protein
MGKFLIVDDEADLRDILRFVLEAKYNIPIIEAGSGEAALEMLRQHSDIDIIFSDYGMQNGNGAIVFNYNKKAKNVPFFLFTGATLEDCLDIKDFYTTHISNCLIGKPFEDDFLFSQIEKACPNLKEDLSLTSTHEFKRLPIEFVSEYVHFSPAIYIKLADRYIKIFHSGDLQSAEDINKYRARGEKYCYLQKNEFKEFIFQITDEIQKKASATEGTSEEQSRAVMDSVVYLQQACQVFGIKEAQQRIITACVESCVKNLHTPPKLQDFAKNIFTKNNYLGGHSLFAIHICYIISRNLSFDFFGQQLLDKFTFAGILHDISLEDETWSELFDLTHPKYLALTQIFPRIS